MLTPGARLGALEVVGPLGAGGMGEVYRARDTRLGRDVAVKVLPEAVADDPERLARFEREARLLAALNHPNIAAIHGIEHANGQPLLVLELVEGPTLAERLRRGPLPIKDALEIARQIAEALEAAHEKGIVHRDLKPSNIKLTADGMVKLLDFGLAKTIARAPHGDVSNAPTDTSPTDGGAVMGTAAYMSPEQARGLAVDRQTDVWAFGCVLYEMLAGHRAFPGATVSDVIAALLDREPDWDALPDGTPALVRVLLRRCLQKDRAQRLRDIGDAYIETEEPTVHATPATQSRPRRQWLWMAAFVAVGATGLVTGTRTLTRSPAARVDRALRLSLHLPLTAPYAGGFGPASIAVSPDGAYVVYVADAQAEGQRLYVRAVGELQPRPIPGTEHGHTPFFSPDGQWLGFGAEYKLKKVPIEGGRPAIVATYDGYLRGASWGDDGAIVFTPTAWSGLWRLTPGATEAAALTTPDAARGESSHRWPQVLPGRRAVVYAIHPASGRQDEGDIAVLSFSTGESRVILRGSMYARYVASGHLLYASGGALLAAPFDLDRLEVTGPATSVVDDVRQTTGGSGVADFDVSRRGDLVYVTGSAARQRSVAWVDRRGNVQPALAESRAYLDGGLGIGPGGRYVFTAVEGTSTADLWRHDLSTDVRERLTFEKDSLWPVLSPGGQRIAFSSNRAGSPILFLMPAAGGRAERLATSKFWQKPTGWSPDGRTVLFGEQAITTGWDIWAVSLDNHRKPRPLVVSRFIEGGAVVSPDGRWLAYASNESGRSEIYVRPYEGGDSRWQVSIEGGVNPVWAADGRELFYLNRGQMMTAPLRSAHTFHAGRARTLFSGRYVDSGPYDPAAFAVTPDGRRFLMLVEAEDPPAPQIVFVPNWFDELKAKVPTGAR